MDQGHLVIDVGPNILALGLQLLSFLGILVAAYFGVASKRAIDTANGHLALAITRQSDANNKADATATHV